MSHHDFGSSRVDLLDLPSEVLGTILLQLLPQHGVDGVIFYTLNDSTAACLRLRHVCRRFRDEVNRLMFGPSSFDQSKTGLYWDRRLPHVESDEFTNYRLNPYAAADSLRTKLLFPREKQSSFTRQLAAVVDCNQLSSLSREVVIKAVTFLAAIWHVDARRGFTGQAQEAKWTHWDTNMAASTVAAYLGQTSLLKQLLKDLPDRSADVEDPNLASNLRGDINSSSDDHDSPDDEVPYVLADKRQYNQRPILIGLPLWAASLASQVHTARMLIEAGLFSREVRTYTMQDLLKNRTIKQMLLNLPGLVRQYSLLAGRKSRFSPKSFVQFIIQGRVDVIHVLLASNVDYRGRPQQLENANGLDRGNIDAIVPALRDSRGGRPMARRRGWQVRYRRPRQVPKLEPAWGSKCPAEMIRTALFIDALCVDQPKVALMLLNLGIDRTYRYKPVYWQFCDELTAIGAAAYAGYHDIFLRLLDGGAIVDASTADRPSPLQLPFEWSPVHPFRPLPSMLSMAALGQQDLIVRLLLKRGADINSDLSQAVTPLHAACYANNSEIAFMLLDRGADPNRNFCFRRSVSALAAAAKHNNAELVARLLYFKADPNPTPVLNKELPSLYHISPLAWAAKHGSLSIVQQLLAVDADLLCMGRPEGTFPENWTPAQVAQDFDHPMLRDVLVARGSPEPVVGRAHARALDAKYANNLPALTESEHKGRTAFKEWLAKAARCPKYQ